MLKILRNITFAIFLGLVLIFPYFIFATENTNALGGLKKLGGQSGYDANTNETTFAGDIGKTVQAILGFLGIIFLCLVIYGGFKWMMGRENTKVADEAITIIKNATIGLIVVLSAYAIWVFVANVFINK